MGNIITSAKCQMMDIINHIDNISFDFLLDLVYVLLFQNKCASFMHPLMQ